MHNPGLNWSLNQHTVNRAVLILIVATLHAPLCSGQSVNEIINGAIKKTGGASNWTALKGIKIKAKFDQLNVTHYNKLTRIKIE